MGAAMMTSRTVIDRFFIGLVTVGATVLLIVLALLLFGGGS
jgi:hypothetical protein